MPNLMQRMLEDMIPELDSYRKHDIFSDLEISDIIENRQRYENRLNRRISKLEDYLRFAKYELELEHIRRSRAASKKQQHQEKSDRSKSKLSFLLLKSVRNKMHPMIILFQKESI